jgi:hypothetical protein
MTILILNYGGEALKLNERDQNNIQGAEMEFLKEIT